MAIEQQEIYYSYTGNGVVTTFAYGCRIFQASDLVVKVAGVVQALGVHYSISGVDAVAGGQVTFLPGYIPTGLVELERVLEYSRVTGYIQNGDFRQETVDRDQDYQTALLQQMEGHRKYYLRQPVGSNVEMQLPAVTPGGLLAWNQAGDGIEYLLTAPPYVSTTVSASAYGTDISAAISAVGSANVTLKVDSPITVNDNAEFHENTFVVVEKPGLLTIASGKVLTFNRQPVLSDGTCFVGPGTVSGLKESKPEQFGGGIAGLQAALNALSSGGTLLITYDMPSLSGKMQISGADITIKANSLRVMTWVVLGTGVSYGSLGTGTAAIENAGTNITFENIKLVGPTTAAYVGNEGAIVTVGASTSNRKEGLHFKNVEICDFGSYGVYTQFVDNVTFDPRCYFHNLGNSGMMHLSPRHIRVGAMRIKTIAPGQGGQMYGLSFSHNSVGYHLDPNVATPLAANPFPQDVIVDGALVDDVNWNPIDFHGGYDCIVTNCKVYNSLHGIALTSSSGDATPYVGWGNSIINNLIDGRNQDGTSSGRENTGHGIVAQGTSTMQHRGLLLSGNKVISKGVVSNASSAGIIANYSESTISDNTVESFGGNGILFNGSTAVTLSGNTADGITNAGDTVGRAFSIATATAINLVATGNKVLANHGVAPKVGLHAPLVTKRPVVSGNDFSAASASQISLPTNGYTKGGDFGCVFSVSALSAGTVSILDSDKDVMIAFGLASGDTLTNVTSGIEGQTLTMVSTGAGNVTVQHGANFTNTSGVDITLGTRDVVIYKRWGARWLMQSFASNP